MVDGLIETHLTRYKESGAELIMGEDRFVEAKTIEVRLKGGGTSAVEAERMFLSTGTRPRVPVMPGLTGAKPLTHVEALELDRVPRHLLVLGGGYVGLEFAQTFRRFGSRVTVIQRGQQLARREDPDTAKALLELLQDEGIEVLLRANVVSVEGASGDNVRLQLDHDGRQRIVDGSDLLVAIGRTPQHRWDRTRSRRGRAGRKRLRESE
jgi:pyruvate/2-oxoglutarate dehydrogenase complex dihydrolipoamide dehydrogenase (E3) component